MLFKMLRSGGKVLVDHLVYGLGLGILTILRLLPRSSLQLFGKGLGTTIFYVISDFRKTALTNLALAFPEKSFTERYQIALKSVQQVIITFIELATVDKFAKHIDEIITIASSEDAPEGFFPEEVSSQQELNNFFSRLDQQEGAILFCGHQANWELPFLYITKRYPGLAFAKPVKNPRLNRKIISLRESFQGKIVPPQNAINQALRALHKGEVVGIVGDQVLLSSQYSYPLFGSQAFTTTSPALLAYKTRKPVIAVAIYRQPNGNYLVVPSKAFYANTELSIRESTEQLMDKLMRFLEKGIACKPEQWLWLHKRWKRKLRHKFKRCYAFSHILLIVKGASLKTSQTFLTEFAEFYADASLSLAIIGTSDFVSENSLSPYSLHFFASEEELLTIPNSFPAVVDLFGLSRKTRSHFKRTGSRKIFTNNELEASLLHGEPLTQRFRKLLRKTQPYSN
ncbi:lipid A biosynthesis lauroyl acyltransferase [Chlamydia muridarum str. Nigg]|uniref:Lipid A biosynthesis lauroyl acyltransferase n=2 Tax=Chlamydia muridarum TaxID=83560 RepID=A0A070A5V4_CHLMR|nr:lipid A biosynthesis lauroyl acyltransferase [Chlamydia muridarum]AAF39146.1 lipid A biosynthesis lauroyl acyltransferase, putative [Chlamydia muridarum str. Nigg]AHH22668.1 lauroyl acyltransferase [Chlamydia muridarum str. Nigg3 CMUT3-5]AHH23592.1 lauroyl acyltransferase [Chlamydia muridarum str. Nigg CM972]AID37814.1 lipid A biosynthesis lauroyl acyltransferase [Chlamydia muridarum str. Nigg 2 MCR]AIT90484.1 lipid A biosynthesis lauroyl acyltransferase [Chlamydia muridarum]